MGLADGDERYLFGQVLGLAVADDGSVFVADGHPQSLRQFGPDGAFVRNFGREGEGPGEFTSIVGIVALPNGRFAIWDSGNRRITVYGGPKGRTDASIRVANGVYAPAAFLVNRKRPCGPFRSKTSMRWGRRVSSWSVPTLDMRSRFVLLRATRSASYDPSGPSKSVEENAKSGKGSLTPSLVAPGAAFLPFRR